MAVLPYDAEVEYLESTAAGREWVNTGFVPSSVTDVLTVDAAYTSAGNTFGCLFGVTSRVNGNQRFYQINKTTTSDQFRLITSTGDVFWTKAPEFSGSRHTYVLNKNVLYIDGTRTITGSGTSAQSAKLYLFARNNAVTASVDTNQAAWRIYSAKLERNGVVQFDLLPVRVGSVGYFYDKVSGTLLPSGGDPLVVGPDKPKLPAGGAMMIANREGFAAAAKKRGWTNPYVTDGLVAMWDGEWNAGGGVHDAAATTWKDLVGGNDFRDFNSGVEFGDKYIAIPAVKNAAVADLYAEADVSTIECCCCPTGRNGLVLVGFAKTNVANNAFIRWVGFRSNGSFNFGHGQTCAYSVTLNEFATYSGTYDQVWNLFKNGQSLQAAGEGMTFGVASLDGTVINPLATTLSATRICSIRLYSRALPAAEIAANGAIDRERFNQP